MVVIDWCDVPGSDGHDLIDGEAGCVALKYGGGFCVGVMCVV